MMIAGDVLRTWIGDPTAREATMERAAATGRALRALPALMTLESALDRLNGDSADGVLGCVRAWVETPGTLQSCLDGLVQGASSDPFFRPPVRAVSTELHAGLVLLSRPDVSLFLAALPPDALAAKRSFGSGPTSISFDGHRSLYHFLKGGGATLTFWEVADCEIGRASC